MLSEMFKAAAEKLAERRISVCPLRVDADGLAKLPVNAGYPRFRYVDNSSHDWSAADGLGIVLGRPSSNLAVIDVDDLGLSDWLRVRLERLGSPPLMVTTRRGRLHVYVSEPNPSRPIDLEVRYQNRPCLVQLLGAVVAGLAAEAVGVQATLLIGVTGMIGASAWLICSPLPRLKTLPST